MPYPFQTALAEYNFTEVVDDATQINDSSGLLHHGTLSASGIWTPLGLRLNGTQTITIPNKALIPAGQDFTVFFAIQNEVSLSSTPSILLEWGLVKLSLDSVNGLSTTINGNGWYGHYYPTNSIPFFFAVRLNAQNKILNVCVVNEFGQHINADIHQQNFTYVFDALSGTLGANFSGTFIYSAIFGSYVSNGMVGEMFRYLNRLLLVRGIETLQTTYDTLSFQAGPFQ